MREQLPFPRPSSEAGSSPIGILVVDDEPMIRELALRTLERAGFVVHQADSGKAAIALLETRAAEIHLVVLDLTMPGLTGEQTLSVLHARWPALKVVLMSGHNMPDADTRWPSVVGFIEKPYLPHDLLHGVEDALKL